MNKLNLIDEVFVPSSCIMEMYSFFQLQGQRGLEAFALWAGKCSGSTFTVTDTIIPAQHSVQLEEGLLYSVDGEELHRINVWLYNQQKMLVAQIHTHPGRAYHSETDDEYPVMATLGGLSIVIPHFASEPFTLNNIAVYRLEEGGTWRNLSLKRILSLIKIN